MAENLRNTRGGRLLAFIRDSPPIRSGPKAPRGGGGGGGALEWGVQGEAMGGGGVGRVGWGGRVRGGGGGQFGVVRGGGGMKQRILSYHMTPVSQAIGHSSNQC